MGGDGGEGGVQANYTFLAIFKVSDSTAIGGAGGNSGHGAHGGDGGRNAINNAHGTVGRGWVTAKNAAQVSGAYAKGGYGGAGGITAGA